MRRILFSTVAIAAVAMGSSFAVAHHSTSYLFDTTKEITLEGQIVRVEWINPHILLYLETKNETWVLEGLGPNAAIRVDTAKEKLKPGVRISARVHPPRRTLALEKQMVQETSSTPTPRIVEMGEIRLQSGEVMTLGRGPGFYASK